MGSTVGSYGPVRIPPANAPDPFLGPSYLWVISPIYDPTYQSNWTTTGGTVYVPFEYGWTAYSFQLIVVGAPVAANCTLQAQPSVSGQWSALPVQNGFSNTLNPGGATGANSRRLSYVKGGGLLRFRFNCGAAFPAETAYALFAAAA